jgi:1-acyl-sn-glycerol-3-phosphate acyltransferase
MSDPTGARGESSLGSDPFTQSDGTLPYLLRMRERTIRQVREEADPPSPGASPTRAAPAPPDLGPPIPEVPEFQGRDNLDTWLDRVASRLLDREDEERLNLIMRSLSARPYDRLGMCPRTTRRSLAVFKLLYRYYFRVESQGHDAIPEKEGSLLVANHGGMLPFDAAMTVVDVFLNAQPPRFARSVVDRWAGTLPFVNVFFARAGQIIGTRENFRQLLRDKQVVLTFPEGMSGIRKLAADRYKLKRFNVGFIEESIRHRVPIVPVAVVGADDQAPILFDVKPIARALGLPFFPITPTFPLLGPLGLLPYPVKYQISYGSPFRFYEEFSESIIDDPHAVRYMAEQVRRRIQEMVDRDALTRRSRKG